MRSNLDENPQKVAQKKEKEKKVSIRLTIFCAIHWNFFIFFPSPVKRSISRGSIESDRIASIASVLHGPVNNVTLQTLLLPFRSAGKYKLDQVDRAECSSTQDPNRKLLETDIRNVFRVFVQIRRMEF